MSEDLLVEELAKRLIEVRNGASRQGNGTRNGLEAMAREVLRQMEYAERIGFNACCGRRHDENLPGDVTLAPPDWKP